MPRRVSMARGKRWVDGRWSDGNQCSSSSRGGVQRLLVILGAALLTGLAADSAVILSDRTACPPSRPWTHCVLYGHRGRLQELSVSPDGRWVAVASSDGRVRLWEIGGLAWVAATLEGHRDEVGAVAFDPGGRVLASGGRDGKLFLWSLDTGTVIRVLDHPSAIWSLAFNPQGTLLAAGTAASSVSVWDVGTGQLVAEFVALPLNLGRTVSTAMAVVFDVAGRCVIGGFDDGVIRIWDLHEEEPSRLLVGHPSEVRALAVNPVTGDLTSAGPGLVFLWPTPWGVHYGRTVARPGLPMNAVAFAPSGDILAAGGSDGRVTLWDTTRWEEIGTLEVGAPVVSISFAPDGDLLAVAGLDRLQLWFVGAAAAEEGETRSDPRE